MEWHRLVCGTSKGNSCVISLLPDLGVLRYETQIARTLPIRNYMLCGQRGKIGRAQRDKPLFPIYTVVGRLGLAIVGIFKMSQELGPLVISQHLMIACI